MFLHFLPIYFIYINKMAIKLSKDSLKDKIREIVQEIMNEMPDESFVKERKLTPAEEEKKEELVKALKPKYGKTPKTYAIATAKAKELAEDSMEERMMSFPYKKMAPRRDKHSDPRHSPLKDLKEDELDFTDKYDDHPALKGKQSRLPDQLQKGIIQKKFKK